MKKNTGKVKMVGLYAVICAGMLLFTGCAGTDTETKNGTAETEASGYPDSDSADIPETAAGKGETSEETETVAGSAAGHVNNAEDGKEASGEMENFADANDMFNSADLNGAASDCSDTGLTINTSPFADGTAASGEPSLIKVVYTDGTVFQKGTVKSDGSGYSLEESGKSVVQDENTVLCFGKQQADGSYTADRIIVIEFN